MKLGNSDQAQVGDWVEAIGSPFALAQTVTAGIVSAKNRTIEPGVAGQFQHFIQTDAAINPGNSGGPLLNMNGEVIGVNTAIYTQSAGYQGIGFAMPANTVVAVYNDLISPSHKVTRGSIGIRSAPGFPALSTAFMDSRMACLCSRCSPVDPPTRAASSPATSSPPSTAAPSRMATNWSATSPAAGPAPRFASATARWQAQDATVTVGDRDKVFAPGGAPEGENNNTPPAGDVGQAKLGIAVRDLPPEVVTKTGIHGVADPVGKAGFVCR